MFVNCIRIHWPRARRCSPTSSGEKGVHCAFSEILTGGGRELETRMWGWLFVSLLFSPFFPSSILGTRHNGWETLWYVTDMNIIHPLFSSSSSSSSLCGCYAKHYTHSVVLQLCEPQCDRGRYTMTIVNTFQTAIASDTLHDNHSILRPSRGYVCEWRQTIILVIL